MDDRMFEDLIAIKIHEQCRTCSKNDVLNEQMSAVRADIRELKASIADLYAQQGLAKNWLIGLLITLLLAIGGYTATKVADNALDRQIARSAHNDK